MFTANTVLTNPELAQAYRDARVSQDMPEQVMEVLDSQLAWWAFREIFQAHPQVSFLSWESDPVGDSGGLRETLDSLRVVGSVGGVASHPAAADAVSATDDLLRSLSAVRMDLFYDVLDLEGGSPSSLEEEWLHVFFSESGAAHMRATALDKGLPPVSAPYKGPKIRF